MKRIAIAWTAVFVSLHALGLTTDSHGAGLLNVARPTITRQPTSQTVLEGTDVTFTVTATGTQPIRYQWRYNGNNLAGATSANYSISRVESNQAGNYSVVVSNAGGSVTSQNAALTVLRNPARPVIVKQPQSQTLITGTTITLSVEATGAAPLTYQWRKNGAVISGATSPTLTLSNATAANEGGYTVVVSNSLGSVRSEVALVSLPVVFVERRLPSIYSAGTQLNVTLQASPPADASVYAVEDRPPANWVVSQISGGGAYDANNKNVKWGPFFDANSRVLSYVATPPAGETGAKEFGGIASVNGVGSPIGGDRVIRLASLHPADISPADSRITLDEVTAYGAAWRKGSVWPAPPNPISIDYVTRGAALWKDGESYVLDPKIPAPPLWWVNVQSARVAGLLRLSATGAEASSPSVVSHLPPAFVAGETFQVRLPIRTTPDVSVYAVQDQIPAGWTAQNPSDGGAIDTVNNQVKWGPFFDNTARELSYEVVPSAKPEKTVAFVGVASFDGNTLPITGQRETRASSRLGSKGAGVSGGQFRFNLTGSPGESYAIEASTDLLNWTRVGEVKFVDGVAAFSDPAAVSIRGRFYRAIAQ